MNIAGGSTNFYIYQKIDKKYFLCIPLYFYAFHLHPPLYFHLSPPTRLAPYSLFVLKHFILRKARFVSIVLAGCVQNCPCKIIVILGPSSTLHNQNDSDFRSGSVFRICVTNNFVIWSFWTKQEKWEVGS